MFLHSLEDSVPSVCLLCVPSVLYLKPAHVPVQDHPLRRSSTWLILIFCLVITSTAFPLALLCSALQELVGGQFCYCWASHHVKLWLLIVQQSEKNQNSFFFFLVALTLLRCVQSEMARWDYTSSPSCGPVTPLLVELAGLLHSKKVEFCSCLAAFAVFHAQKLGR